MAADSVFNPQVPGSDLKIPGAVDTLGGTGAADRPTSEKVFPNLIHVVDYVTGHFLRLVGAKTGTVDGHEVGELTVGASATTLVWLDKYIGGRLAAIGSAIFEDIGLLERIQSAVPLLRRILLETRTSQNAAQTSTTPGGLVGNEFRELVLAGYNWLGRYLSTTEANPLSVQVLEQQLAAALSLAAGDTYYPSANGALMTGYKDLSVEFILLAGAAAGDSITLTLQISQDTTVPPAVGTWVDVTLAGFDLATGAPSAASYSAAAGATVTDTVDWDNLDVRQWRIKVTVVKATNNSTITLLTTRQKAL